MELALILARIGVVIAAKYREGETMRIAINDEQIDLDSIRVDEFSDLLEARGVTRADLEDAAR